MPTVLYHLEGDLCAVVVGCFKRESFKGKSRQWGGTHGGPSRLRQVVIFLSSQSSVG
jgi:hypothetical protein